MALRQTLSYETSLKTALPLGIATVAMPGVHAPVTPALVPTTCRSNLLRLDGRPVSVSVSGSTASALDGDGLTVSLCGPDASGIELPAGTHILQATDGAVTGLNLDQLALDSAAGGKAMAEPAGGQLTAPAPAPQPAPKVTVTSQSATAVHVTVHGASHPSCWCSGRA